jgi:hypothetical protein
MDRLKKPVTATCLPSQQIGWGLTMFQDGWGLYEARHPKKWIFHPRKRSVMGPLFTLGAAVLVLFEAFSRF